MKRRTGAGVRIFDGEVALSNTRFGWVGWGRAKAEEPASRGVFSVRFRVARRRPEAVCGEGRWG